MFLGLILSIAGIAFLVGLMFRLASFALPVWFGVMVFLWAAGSDPGPLLGILLGLLVGVAVFIAGRLLIASNFPLVLRAGVALLFALPVGVAGYSTVTAFMHLGGAGPISTMIFAVIGGVIIAGVALANLAAPLDPAGDPRYPARSAIPR